MLSEKQIQQLVAENEFLLAQVEDLNQELASKTNELEEIKKRARKLQSDVDMNTMEYDQLQEVVPPPLNQGEADILRLQNHFLGLAGENEELKANLQGSGDELEMASALFKKVRDLNAELTATRSKLEIAELQIEALQAKLK